MKQALKSPQPNETVQHLTAYVAAHLGKPSIAEACTTLSLTRRTLQRRLYEAGTSFQKIVISTRIRVAEKLLGETSEAITHIASEVGFATLQAFSSAFRRETGLSPSGYRSAALKGAIASPSNVTVPSPAGLGGAAADGDSEVAASKRSAMTALEDVTAAVRDAAPLDSTELEGAEHLTAPPASGPRLVASEHLRIAASG